MGWRGDRAGQGHRGHLTLPVSQEQRLRQRNTETEESLAKRLAAARADMESSEWARLLSAALPRLHGGRWVAPGALWTVPMVTGAFAGPPLPGKEPGLFDLVIINDSLEQAYQALKEALSEVGLRSCARGGQPQKGGAAV